MFAVVCVATLLVGFGLLQFIAPDLIWSLTEWNNQMRGIQSERTETWEFGRVVSGVILIVCGIVLGLWGWSANAENAARDAEATAVVQLRATEAASLASQFDAAFEPVINTLREQASEVPQRIRAADVGLAMSRATMLDYGRCEDGGAFYLYVINDEGNDYAYASATGLCRHPYLSASSARDLGESAMGGRWFSLSFLRDNSALQTTVFKPVATAIAPTMTPLGAGD